MSDLKSQKEIASRILKCGLARVWFDPSRIADIADAITAEDIRKLVNDGIIKVVPKKGISNFRKKALMKQKSRGRRKGKGSRRGRLNTRMPRKELWMKKIRSIRKLLKELKAGGSLDNRNYRKLYMMAKSGYFRGRTHIADYMNKEGLLKAANTHEEKKKTK